MPEAMTLFMNAHHKHPNILELEPETIRDELGVTSKQVCQILALGNVMKNHSAFEDYHVFQKTVLEINDRTVDFSFHQDLGVPEIEWAVCVMRMIDPVFPFSNEVLSFMAVHLHEEGFTQVPFFLAQQSSISGINVEFFLNQLNHKHDITRETKALQDKLIFEVNNYVQSRYELLNEELLGGHNDKQ